MRSRSPAPMSGRRLIGGRTRSSPFRPRRRDPSRRRRSPCRSPTEVDLGCRRVADHRWHADGVRPRHRRDRRTARRRTLVAERACPDRAATFALAARARHDPDREPAGIETGLDVDRVRAPRPTVRPSPAVGPSTGAARTRQRTTRTVHVAPCPVRLLGRARRRAQRRMGRRGRWRRPWRRRAARRRWVQRLEPSALGRRPNGDIHMDRRSPPSRSGCG